MKAKQQETKNNILFRQRQFCLFFIFISIWSDFTMKKPTQEEIVKRILNSGVDATTEDTYVNAITPMTFYCSNGHKWKTKLGNITHNHQGCPYCSGRNVVVGETDLWTTKPRIAALLLNPEDGYCLKSSSGKHIDFKCPNCGAISNHILSNITKRGFSCPVCSDGISYPNKFMAAMLEQLDIEYTPEYTLAGAKYRYDFYLPHYQVFIEMHGRQHYEEWGKSSNLSLLDRQKIDADKEQYAAENGINHYIIIDSKYSDISYISEQIKKSYLSEIFDLSCIDWDKCGFYAAGSILSQVAELYNDGYNVNFISKILKADISSVYKWLHKATELKLCNWVKSNGFLNRKHPVVLVNTKERFESISNASKKYNTSFANISRVCLGKSAYAGLHPETGEPLVWRYEEEFNPSEDIDFMSLINPHAKPKKSYTDKDCAQTT